MITSDLDMIENLWIDLAYCGLQNKLKFINIGSQESDLA